MGALLIRLLLLLLPFLLFFLWLRYIKGKKQADGTLDPRTERNLTVISVVGLVAFVAGMITLILTSDETTRDKVYVPPTTVDGEVVPGHFEDRPDTDPDDPDKN